VLWFRFYPAFFSGALKNVPPNVGARGDSLNKKTISSKNFEIYAEYNDKKPNKKHAGF